MVGLEWRFVIGLIRGGCGLFGRSGFLVCGFLGVVDTCRKTRHGRLLVHLSAAKQTSQFRSDSRPIEGSLPSWWSVWLL